MTKIKNYTSGVPVARTMARIEEVLVSGGASNIMKDYRNGSVDAVCFVVHEPTTNKRMAVRLPANVDAVYETLRVAIKRPRTGTLEKLKDQAKKDAKKLAASLGPKWTPHVSENMGWHHSALSPCGRIYLTPGYCAFLGDPFSFSGRWAEQGRTAKAAVRNVIRTAKHELAKINACVKNLPVV
jgi:hypothetical protein